MDSGSPLNFFQWSSQLPQEQLPARVPLMFFTFKTPLLIRLAVDNHSLRSELKQNEHAQISVIAGLNGLEIIDCTPAYPLDSED